MLYRVDSSVLRTTEISFFRKFCHAGDHTWTDKEWAASRKLVAEFIGTFTMVFAGCGAVAADELTRGGVTPFGDLSHFRSGCLRHDLCDGTYLRGAF